MTEGKTRWWIEVGLRNALVRKWNGGLVSAPHIRDQGLGAAGCRPAT